MNYFEDRFRRNDGLFRSSVSPDGFPVGEAAMLYDQAFALLAMASLYYISPQRTKLREDANALLEIIVMAMQHSAGGFRETSDSAFQSNPHMHLLEAALAWAEIGEDTRWDKLADEIVQLCLEYFIDRRDGFLREHFKPDWTPACGDLGRVVEPGHQFEWAWLLERWARRRNRPDASRAAQRLFATGLHGIDPVRDVAVDELNDDMSIRSGRARLWPQTERLKASLLLAETSEPKRQYYYAHALAAVNALWKYLATPTRGLWRDKLNANNSFVVEPAPASSFYHIIDAIRALNVSISANKAI